ncbi:MAG: hypothetical protein ACRDPA_22070, partial [Solirubrobacteraceae bacterium]
MRSEDTLRVVRLLLEAHAPIPSALLVDGADAANLAGDPELAGELARLAVADGAGLPAALALGLALNARGAFEEAEAALASVEAEAVGHELAIKYLDQRTRVLFWGLGEIGETHALLERARSWSGDPGWPWRLLAVSMPSAVSADLPGAIAALRAALADPALDQETRRILEPRYSMALFYGGAWNEAWQVARRCRPSIPVRDYPGLVGLAALRFAGVLSGAEWSALEPKLINLLVEGVRQHDHEAAGQGALALGQMAFIRGYFRDADRWLAEAEFHFERQDAFGTIADVLVIQVGVAYFTGDADRAAATLARLRAIDNDGRPHPLSRPVYVQRAEGWAACARDAAGVADELLTTAERFAVTMPALAALLVYDA